MKKYVNHWNEFTVYAFNFKGPSDFCQYVRRAEINTSIFSREKIKESGSEGSDITFCGGGWFQTKNISEAINFCEDGWHQGYDFFRSLKENLSRNGDKMMILPKDKSKPIKILVNLTYQWETTNAAIINRGVIIQNLIHELEHNGYKVDLKTFALHYCEKELSCVVINLKGADELLDVRKAYFAFCNASFLRRLVFRVMESSDFKEQKWAEHYGIVCSSDFIKKAFNTEKLDVVIPQSWEIGITGEDIVKDWKRFVEYENLQDCFNS